MRKVVGCACTRNAGNVFPAIASVWCTCRDACRDRWLAVSFEVVGWENAPGIPGACATRNFTYVVRGPLPEAQDHWSSIATECYCLMITNHIMVTSWHGIVFYVSGPLCRESSGHRWIPIFLDVSRNILINKKAICRFICSDMTPFSVKARRHSRQTCPPSGKIKHVLF